MSKPARHADPDDIVSSTRTFFVTTETAMRKRLLQTERNANLLIDVLRTNIAGKKFEIHDFVIMPDHVHILLTIGADMTIERAMQLIKGGFSYRLKKEVGYSGEVWHRGFTDQRVNDRESFLAYRHYIAQNPVKAGLVDSAKKFPFCFAHLSRQKAAGAKAQGVGAMNGTTEVVPLHEAKPGEACSDQSSKAVKHLSSEPPNGTTEVVPFHEAKPGDASSVPSPEAVIHLSPELLIDATEVGPHHEPRS